MSNKKRDYILLVGSGDESDNKEWIEAVDFSVVCLNTIQQALYVFPFLANKVKLLIVDPFVSCGDETFEGLVKKMDGLVPDVNNEELIGAIKSINMGKQNLMLEHYKPNIQEVDDLRGYTLLKILAEKRFRRFSQGNLPYKGKILISTSNVLTPGLAQQLFRIPLDIVGIIPDNSTMSPRNMIRAVKAALEHDFPRIDQGGYRIVAEWPTSGCNGPVNSKMLMIDHRGERIEAGLLTRQDPMDKQSRTSVCVPYLFSGVKCPNECSFCRHAITQKRHNRHYLTPEEMVTVVKKSIMGNLFHPGIDDENRFSIVLLGGGDPGLSRRVLCNAFKAIELFNETFGLRLMYTLFSTISADAVGKLIEMNPEKVFLQVTATFSGKERKKYMPKASSLRDLVTKGVEYMMMAKRKMIINHMLVDGWTDSDEAVDAIIAEIRAGVGNNKKILADILVKLSSFEPKSGLEETHDWKSSRGRAREVAARFEKAGMVTVFWHKHPSSEGGEDMITLD